MCACAIGNPIAAPGTADTGVGGLLRHIPLVHPGVPGPDCSNWSGQWSGGAPFLFVVDKAGAPIFESADYAAAQVGESFPIGKHLFADDVRADCGRMRVLELSSDGVPTPVGWMRMDDLLVDWPSAMDIGRAIRQGLAVERPTIDSGINEGNGLKLHFVTKPGPPVMLGVRPGDDSGEALPAVPSFLYVYDIEQQGGAAWGLMGKPAGLPLKNQWREYTDATVAERQLLGWVALSKLQMRATNLALELNTHPDAVAHRFARGHGAQVMAARHGGAKVIYQEPLDHFWAEGEANPMLEDEVDFDPFGIGPGFPRFAVVDAHPGYLAVSSAASRVNTLSVSDIGRIRRKLQRVAIDLRKVDIVFVLDTTGSMRGAIESTHDFLAQVSERMKSVDSPGGTRVVDLGVAGELGLPSNLDLAVSLIGFQDIPLATGTAYTTREYLSSLDIVRDFPGISAGFSQAKRDLSGGREALHHGVLRALEKKFWREASAARLIVVISDEPGESDMQQAVYDQLPIYSAELLRALPSLRSPSHDEQKKEVIQVVSLYLGPEEGRQSFSREKRDVFPRDDRVCRLRQRRHTTGAAGCAGRDSRGAAGADRPEPADLRRDPETRCRYVQRTGRGSGPCRVDGARDDGASRTHLRRHRETVEQSFRSRVYRSGACRED